MIRENRINASTKVLPDTVIDLGGLEHDIKDKLEQISAKKLGVESEVDKATRQLSSGIQDIVSTIDTIKNGLPALSPSAIEAALSKVLGPKAGAEGAAIIDALLKMPKAIIDNLKAVAKKVSCALHGIDIKSLIFGLAGYFTISGANLCNPADDIARILGVTKGVINKNVSKDTLKAIAKISGGTKTLNASVANATPTSATRQQNTPGGTATTTTGTLVPNGVNPSVYENNPTAVSNDDLGMTGGFMITKTPLRTKGVQVDTTGGFDPSDYTEEELREIMLGTLKPEGLDQVYDPTIATTIPKVAAKDTGVIEIRYEKSENYQTGSVGGSPTSAPRLGGFKPTTSIHLETLVNIEPILPPEVLKATNVAVGIGIAESFKVNPSVSNMIITLLANSHWVKTYMTNLPNRVISSIKPSKDHTIEKVFLEELDKVYPDWHRNATEGKKDIYSGLENFTRVKERYLPDLKCLIDDNKLFGTQKLMMFGLSRSLPEFNDAYRRFPGLD